MLRVVTLPPDLPSAEAAVAFAREARQAGADALELRTDLHAKALPLPELAAALPLLVSERGAPLPEAWVAQAAWVDRAVPGPADGRTLLSHHAPAPLSPAEAEALWRQSGFRQARGIKHVEPLGDVRSAGRLLETQARLIALAGAGKVTVLATGREALPFRAVLAEKNALDYLACSPQWAAAPGQRLLADAVRAGEGRAARGRLGILGAAISSSRSPRIHRQPFDRIELPPDTFLSPVLEALLPHYRGLAVTSPFKQAAAKAAGGALAAVNTLVRRDGRWEGLNTDVEGAREVLEELSAPVVTVLGDGGVTAALRLAARPLGIELEVVARAQAEGPVEGAAIWTWPASVEAPRQLSLRGAQVAVIAYGPPGHEIARAVRARGGAPLRLGPRWFIAQARAQRAAWDAA